MCRRAPAASLTAPRRPPGPWCALAVLLSLAGQPAGAQQPPAPAPMMLPPPRTAQTAPAPTPRRPPPRWPRPHPRQGR
jgi:hypothetical protein